MVAMTDPRKQGRDEFATGIMRVHVTCDLGCAADYLASIGIFSGFRWANMRAVTIDDTSYVKIIAGCPTSVVRQAAYHRVIMVKSLSLVATGDVSLVVQSGRNPILAVVGSVPLAKLNMVKLIPNPSADYDPR